MAQKRMFNKKITDSDKFLDLPLSAQALYLPFNAAFTLDIGIFSPCGVTYRDWETDRKSVV